MSQSEKVKIKLQSEYFEVYNKYQHDVSPLKVDLVYGTFRSEDGSIYLLPVVKKAQNIVMEEILDNNYLPLKDNENFSKLASTLLFGDIEKQWEDGKIFSIQSQGGSDALKLGAEFVLQHLKCTTFYYSNPSWENHGPIFLGSGFQNECTYRYLNKETKSIDFIGLCEDLSNAPSNSVIILHACGHNPTGIDPTKCQWKTIAKIIKERKLIPFFDIAFQGYASGDIEKDVWVVRYFLSKGFNFLCAQSFSKIFTMYDERIGNLTIVMQSANNVNAIKSEIERTGRCNYSKQQNHGTRTIIRILNNSELFTEWSSNFQSMVIRMREIRRAFREALEESGAPGTWNHVTDQNGMFIFFIFTDCQMEHLRKFHHIYMVKPGRINVTGLNITNINYVAKAIADSLKKKINKVM